MIFWDDHRIEIPMELTEGTILHVSWNRYIVFRQRETGGYVKQSGSSKGKATTSYNVDNIPLTVVLPPATSTSYAYRIYIANSKPDQTAQTLPYVVWLFHHVSQVHIILRYPLLT